LILISEPFLVLPPEVKKVIQARAVPVGSLSHAVLVAEGGLRTNDFRQLGFSCQSVPLGKPCEWHQNRYSNDPDDKRADSKGSAPIGPSGHVRDSDIHWTHKRLLSISKEHEARCALKAERGSLDGVRGRTGQIATVPADSIDERLTKPRVFGTVLRAALERDAVQTRLYAFEQNAQIGKINPWLPPIALGSSTGISPEKRRSEERRS
jgi:hypothetical protein